MELARHSDVKMTMRYPCAALSLHFGRSNCPFVAPIDPELLLKERAQQAGVPVESFVLQAVT